MRIFRDAYKIAGLAVFAAACAFASSETAMPRALLQEIESNNVLKVQIALDVMNLSPGSIDGVWGRRTAVAFETWKAANAKTIGRAASNLTVKAALESGLLKVPQKLFSSVAVPAGAADELVAMPGTPQEKALLKRMGYATLLEKYAEAGHCTENALKRWNPEAAWPNPPEGTVLFIPCAGKPERKTGIVRSIRISLGRFELTAFDADGKLVALFPCSIAESKQSLPPAGEIRVTAMASNPDYTYKMQIGGDTKTYIYPPGPNSPVGTRWIGLSLSGYGIHGTPNPDTVGRAESHGCFRLANWNAGKLFDMLDSGTAVVIEE
jgi:lipoprotein-anchoring transpeptidase ErfK/SrfK